MQEMYEDFFPERLATLRNNKAISARDMSLSIGQNPGYINNIETGKALPSMNAFFYICEFLGITPQEFFDISSPDPIELKKVSANLKKLNSEQLKTVSLLVDYIIK